MSKQNQQPIHPFQSWVEPPGLRILCFLKIMWWKMMKNYSKQIQTKFDLVICFNILSWRVWRISNIINIMSMFPNFTNMIWLLYLFRYVCLGGKGIPPLTPQHVSINKPRNLPRFDDKVMVRTPNILAWHQMSTRNGGQHRTAQLSQFVWHGIESNFCVFPSFKKKRAVHTKSVNFARNAATSVQCWSTNAVAPANAILSAGAETKVKCSWLQLFACVLFRHGHVPQLTFFVNFHSASVHFLIVNVYKIGSQFLSCWGPNFPQDVFFAGCFFSQVFWGQDCEGSGPVQHLWDSGQWGPVKYWIAKYASRFWIWSPWNWFFRLH